MQFSALIVGAFAFSAFAAPQSTSTSPSTELAVAVSSLSSIGKPQVTPSAVDISDPYPDFTALIRNVQVPGDGFAHLADDGVFRFYAPNGTVLHAIPFSNAQIRSLLEIRPPVWEPYRNELERIFENIDGNTVDATEHDVLLNPPVNLKPAVFGGPDHAMPELDAKLEDLIKTKKIDATSVEQKHFAFAKSINIGEDQTVDPRFQTKVDLNMKPGLWCLGQLCSSHEGCRIMGCQACSYVDAVLSKIKVCF
ncbi:hypothetical protein CB0940_12103 [Cercospora beticola]|uniref:Uncharacterized protein n=1 Tax=Cercospora beticola TaxID=122368 RepID=A0A2G5GI94_CERBT|nr:hypothetical protein CB0940_12103 [Cercospora beticola]PIA80001.1 hypothetical protein CB0940_12103 [Cercospora beticola]WPB07664.1 hypothetical protein RHO25_012325 [Cercospora beticola]CAK1356533.1 unnamed protein product [Cercospora beticola]